MRAKKKEKKIVERYNGVGVSFLIMASTKSETKKIKCANHFPLTQNGGIHVSMIRSHNTCVRIELKFSEWKIEMRFAAKVTYHCNIYEFHDFSNLVCGRKSLLSNSPDLVLVD